MHQFFPLLVLLVLPLAAKEALCISKFTRNDFPPDFVFGAGTSSYQYEGALAEDGRTPSIWDTFTHKGWVPDKSTGDLASDGYHKHKEDAKLMSEVGLEAYRFSISWSRILPNGRGLVNPKGLEYYKSVINEIFQRGIQIHVSLHHLDLPQILEDEYGGWISPNIVDDFKEYADLCFREFGDMVSHWTTIVEPNVHGLGGYDSGVFAPARCSPPFGIRNCTAGNSTVEPYFAVHNMLIAHAKVVRLYRTKILNPIVFGDYPNIMKKIASPKLPNFTKSQSTLLKGSFDFIGLNHYTSAFVADNSDILKTPSPLRDCVLDAAVKTAASRDATPETTFIPINPIIDPDGLQNMLEYLKQTYGDPQIYVEENGYGVKASISSFNDSARINFLSQHIGATLEAIMYCFEPHCYLIF